MKEIGGYMDFERYDRPMLHEDAIRLNCGRSCLAYLIRARKIRKILLPYFICDSVIRLCREYSLDICFYHVGLDLKSETLAPQKDEWLYLVNYYGQLSAEEIQSYRLVHERLIVDNTQAYFDEPFPGVDTLYTCRKYLGVADGGLLYTDAALDEELERDESYSRMSYLTGRFERGAADFYAQSVENNRVFDAQGIKKMSRLTENLLRSFDYDQIRRRRTENCRALAQRLGAYNKLSFTVPEGAFAYPLMIEDAQQIRKELIANKVYVPLLWPNLLELPECTDRALAESILPLPCDQRYGAEEMAFISDLLEEALNR